MSSYRSFLISILVVFSTVFPVIAYSDSPNVEVFDQVNGEFEYMPSNVWTDVSKGLKRQLIFQSWSMVSTPVLEGYIIEPEIRLYIIVHKMRNADRLINSVRNDSFGGSNREVI